MSKQILLLIAALWLSLPLALAEPTVIPFQTNDEGMVAISATIGNVSARALLDTGAGLSLMAPSLLKKMDARPAGYFTGFRMSGERLDIPLFIVPSLTVGTMTKRDVSVGVLEVLDKVGIQAIISMNEFREQPFTIDFVHKNLVLETPKSLKQRRGAGLTVPMLVDDYRGSVLDLFAEFKIGKQTAVCEIDTGDPGTAVNLRFMEPLGINKDSEGVQKVSGKTITGAERVRYKTNVPQLALKAAPAVASPNAPVAFSDIIFDCVVGVDFWSNKILTIDIPGRKITVATH